MPTSTLTPEMMANMSPEQIAMIQQQQAMAASFGPGFLIFQIVVWVFFAYCLYILAKKLGEQYTWMAWVPVLNVVLMLRMAKMSLWWILGLIVPFLNIYVIVKMFHDGISKRTGHGGWWTAGLIFAGWLFWPVTALHYEKGDEITPRPFTGWKK